MSNVVLLSDNASGIEEDIVLVNSFRRFGVSAEICDWKQSHTINSSTCLAIIRSTWDYSIQYQKFTDTLHALSQRIRLINSFGLVEKTISKKYLLDLADAGIATIPSVFISNADQRDIQEGLASLDGDRFILKSAVGAGGHNMHLFHKNNIPVTASLSGTFANGGGALLQSYRDDIVTSGEWALVFFGSDLALSILKRAANNEFRVQRTHGGTETEMTPPPALVNFARNALAALPEMPDYARVDILPSSDGPLLIELEVIEPRLYFDVQQKLAEQFADYVVKKYSLITESSRYATI